MNDAAELRARVRRLEKERQYYKELAREAQQAVMDQVRFVRALVKEIQDVNAAIDRIKKKAGIA